MTLRKHDPFAQIRSGIGLPAGVVQEKSFQFSLVLTYTSSSTAAGSAVIRESDPTTLRAGGNHCEESA